MYCVKCGKQLPENSLFCPYCGQKIKSGSMGVISSFFRKLSAGITGFPYFSLTGLLFIGGIVCCVLSLFFAFVSIKINLFGQSSISLDMYLTEDTGITVFLLFLIILCVLMMFMRQKALYVIIAAVMLGVTLYYGLSRSPSYIREINNLIGTFYDETVISMIKGPGFWLLTGGEILFISAFAADIFKADKTK